MVCVRSRNHCVGESLKYHAKLGTGLDPQAWASKTIGHLRTVRRPRLPFPLIMTTSRPSSVAIVFLCTVSSSFTRISGVSNPDSCYQIRDRETVTAYAHNRVQKALLFKQSVKIRPSSMERSQAKGQICHFSVQPLTLQPFHLGETTHSHQGLIFATRLLGTNNAGTVQRLHTV